MLLGIALDFKVLSDNFIQKYAWFDAVPFINYC
jgi:hypothetical protein